MKDTEDLCCRCWACGIFLGVFYASFADKLKAEMNGDTYVRESCRRAGHKTLHEEYRELTGKEPHP